MATVRRNRPGTKSVDLYMWPEQDLNEIDGSFAVQSYIQQLIRKDPSAVKSIVSLPSGQSEDEWIYEHMRQFVSELNGFIIHHNEVCTAQTQPSMKMSINGEEFLFLCSAFDPPKEVSAIDYMAITVAQSAAILNSSKLFPNRMSISRKAKKEIVLMARRLYRIFAFSYFVHREQFDEFENLTHLCERFTVYLKMYDLMSEDLFLIPEPWGADVVRGSGGN